MNKVKLHKVTHKMLRKFFPVAFEIEYEIGYSDAEDDYNMLAALAKMEDK